MEISRITPTWSESARCFLDMLPVRVRNSNPSLGSACFSQSREALYCENTRLFDVGSYKEGGGIPTRGGGGGE